MNNPVMDHLVRARMEEHQQSQAQRDAEVARLCAERLNLPATPQPTGNGSAWQAFVHWTAARGLAAFPATPATCGLYVIDNALLGIERLLQIIEAISAAHENAGAADPTLGKLVALACDQIAPVKSPRSWPKEDKLAFLQLPRQLQQRVLDRETQRDVELRRAQTATDDIRKQLDKLQKEKIENEVHKADAAA